jgi:hypothetical protein
LTIVAIDIIKIIIKKGANTKKKLKREEVGYNT